MMRASTYFILHWRLNYKTKHTWAFLVLFPNAFMVVIGGFEEVQPLKGLDR